MTIAAVLLTLNPSGFARLRRDVIEVRSPVACARGEPDVADGRA